MVINILMSLILVFSLHLFGDFILQTRYIAELKGKEWYMMWVHCTLYTLPFLLIWPNLWIYLFIWITHFICDTAKARHKLISLRTDQIFHLIVLFDAWIIMNIPYLFA